MVQSHQRLDRPVYDGSPVSVIEEWRFRMVHVKHLACVATLAGVTASVSAGPVFNLNIEFSGATPPAGAAPWMTVSFTQGTGLNSAKN